jgi:hypothetical protein
MQFPQCCVSTLVSTQRGLPPQSWTVAGDVSQVHAPPLHVPSPQSAPQAPQFLASVCVSTHLLPHATWPAGHWQTPAWQLPPVGQMLLPLAHAPQWTASVRRSKQLPSQLVCPEGHTTSLLLEQPAAKKAMANATALTAARSQEAPALLLLITPPGYEATAPACDLEQAAGQGNALSDVFASTA